MAGSDHDVGRALSSPRVGKVQGLILPALTLTSSITGMFHVKHDSPELRRSAPIGTTWSRYGWCPGPPAEMSAASSAGGSAYHLVTRAPSYAAPGPRGSTGRIHPPHRIPGRHHRGRPVDDGSRPSCTTRGFRSRRRSATPVGRLIIRPLYSPVTDLGGRWPAISRGVPDPPVQPVIGSRHTHMLLLCGPLRRSPVRLAVFRPWSRHTSPARSGVPSQADSASRATDRISRWSTLRLVDRVHAPCRAPPLSD